MMVKTPSPGKTSNIRDQVWEIRLVKDGQRNFLKTLDTTGTIQIWNEASLSMDIMVRASNVDEVIRMFLERDIPYEVAIPDVNELMESKQSHKNENEHNPREIPMNWTSYHRLETIYQFMEDLAAQNPRICTIITIGKSVEGRNILVLKISNGLPANPGVWIDGTIHAREWITSAVVTYIADNMVKKFAELPKYVTNKDWFLLPVLNPDGYEYTHTTDRLWRKNRAAAGSRVHGVDLNRNFGYGWGEGEGSSPDPSNVFYRGPNAFSEPESKSVRNFITDSTTKFKVFLSLHSYGEVVLFPWGYTDEPCPDYVELLEGGTAMSKAIYQTSGHTYKVGSTKDLMYYAAGTSIDWSYGQMNIPYSYMLELRDKKSRFLLPAHEIISNSLEVYNGVFELMKFVDRVR